MLLNLLSKLYGLGVAVRNHLYDSGRWKSIEFTVPTIAVGNLRVGGTGKTPHIEYLIRKLSQHYPMATLSRGYRRQTQGYLRANPQSTAQQIGDEPMQLYRKFGKQIQVAVCENRAIGIAELLHEQPNISLILLDDAYQHRSVMPCVAILLTQYHQLFTKDQLLPKGRLREPANQKKRANIIIITQCPDTISTEQQQQIRTEIAPLAHQKLFFSYLRYEKIYHWQQSQQYPTSTPLHAAHVLLVCAIAQPQQLQSYLQQQCQQLSTLTFGDHHNFSKQDIDNIITTFEQIESTPKIIITTEKDAVRLQLHQQALQQLPIFVLPITVAFEPTAERQLLQYLHQHIEQHHISK